MAFHTMERSNQASRPMMIIPLATPLIPRQTPAKREGQ